VTRCAFIAMRHRDDPAASAATTGCFANANGINDIKERTLIEISLQKI
jgi:hypothetical protein